MKEIIIKYTLPIGIVLGSIILGFIVQTILLSWLRHLVKKSKLRSGQIIIHSLRGWIILWIIIAGVSIALPYFISNPQILSVINKIILIGVIFSVTISIANISVGFVDIFLAGAKETIPKTSILTIITRIFVLIIGILIILNSLGISISPILAGLGIGGLAVALALQDTLSNLIAGLQIILSRQLRPGDYVQLSTGEEGYVVDITWRNTTIRELADNLIIIPNSKLSQSIVKNFHMPDKSMAVIVPVRVDYESDLEKVEEIVTKVAKETLSSVRGGERDFEPFIRYSSFSDYGIEFSVILRVDEYANQFLVKHEFIKRLHKTLKKERIRIPYPVRTVYIEGKEGEG
jgi:small-conductance mechanosensitive channel